MVMGPRTLAPAPIDVVAHGGMALAAAGARDAQGDLMIQIAIVANLRGLPDHHAHAVVDHQATAEPGGGVNLDPGEPAGNMGGEAAQQKQPVFPQPMGQFMPEHRVQTRVTEQHFHPGTCRWITFAIGLDGLT